MSDTTTDQQRIAELPEPEFYVWMDSFHIERTGRKAPVHVHARPYFSQRQMRDALAAQDKYAAPLIERIAELESKLRFERSHVQQLQKALSFWLPMVPESPEVISNRVANDAMLLMGYGGEDEPSAEALRWIALASSQQKGEEQK